PTRRGGGADRIRAAGVGAPVAAPAAARIAAETLRRVRALVAMVGRVHAGDTIGAEGVVLGGARAHLAAVVAEPAGGRERGIEAERGQGQEGDEQEFLHGGRGTL